MQRTTRCALLGLFALLGLSGLPAHARANPSLEAGIEAAHDGEFEKALEQFETALKQGRLKREQLVSLLRQRVLVRFALQQKKKLRGDLALLLAIDPECDLGAMAPPDLSALVRTTSEEIPELKLRLEAAPVSEGVGIRATTEGERESFDLSVRIGVRIAPAQWQLSEAREVQKPADAGAEVVYYAEVVGPGNAVVAQEGSQESPLKFSMPMPVAATPVAEEEHKSSKWWWIGSGISGIALAAIGAGLGVSLAMAGSGGGPSRDVSAPMVAFP